MITQKLALKAIALGIVATASIGQSMAQQETVLTQQPAAPQIQTFMQPDNLNELRQSQVLGFPTSHCGHVIDLMMTNRMRQQTNQVGTPEIYLPHMTVGTKTGDLELLCVNLVCDGDHCKGPVFQIGMRNNSTVPIGNFQVSLVGVLGQIHVHSPTMTVRIDRMECGEEKHVQVQLPVTCMSMHCATGTAAFDSLVVALDSYDELLECNELNNIQILKRCDIGVLVTETVVVAPTEVAPGPAPVAPVPAAPLESSPLDNLDLDNLDNLDLGDAKNLLFRR
jgi:hypothetical protein